MLHLFDLQMARWFPLILFSIFLHAAANGQTQIGLSVNVGDRQHYSSSVGFKKALAPSASLSISKTKDLNDKWKFRYGAVAGLLGYKLNVVMIDTLGPNGDVSPFPEYSIFFASAEFLFGRQFPVFNRPLLLGAGVGVTAYLSAAPVSQYSVDVMYPNNRIVSLFDARMTSPASRYSILWKAAAYYEMTNAFSLGLEYVYHNNPAAEGSYIFYHTRTVNAGDITIYQREFRLGIYYRISSVNP
jgi:hypothetical protein